MLKLVIFIIWKNYEISKKSSVTWSWKDKGVASSWESHAHFSWVNFTRYLAIYANWYEHHCSTLEVLCVDPKYFGPLWTTYQHEIYDSFSVPHHLYPWLSHQRHLAALKEAKVYINWQEMATSKVVEHWKITRFKLHFW